MKVLIWLGLAAFWMGVALLCSGCAAPLLLGIKSYESGDTKVEFITGADFTIGANGVDSVDNNRGISPKGGYKDKKED